MIYDTSSTLFKSFLTAGSNAKPSQYVPEKSNYSSDNVLAAVERNGCSNMKSHAFGVNGAVLTADACFCGLLWKGGDLRLVTCLHV